MVDVVFVLVMDFCFLKVNKKIVTMVLVYTIVIIEAITKDIVYSKLAITTNIKVFIVSKMTNIISDLDNVILND